MDNDEFVLVRQDSQNKVEIFKKKTFDSTGYSFLKYRESGPMIIEEWVETDKLETYKKLEQ